MIKNKIKIVKKGIIETNSSSSHSLTLGKNNFIKPGDKEWDINIKDRILYIPTCKDFGWEYFKFNSCQQKLQYLSGLFFYDGDISISAQKEMRKLKSLLCKVFDIDDVIFEWVEDYKKNNLKEEMDMENFNPMYADFCPICVDHESRDLKDEIIETEDTLKSFLFSRDSWVFGGNDSSDVPNGFFKEEKQSILNATASIDFPGLGRIDFRIYYPQNITKYISKSLNFIYSSFQQNNILNYFLYDIRKKVVYPIYYFTEKEDINTLDSNNYMNYREIISYKGDYYCLFTQLSNDDDILYNKETNWLKAVKLMDIHIFKSINTTFKETSNKLVSVIESGLVKKDIDYKLFKIKIKHDDLEYIDQN